MYNREGVITQEDVENNRKDVISPVGNVTLETDIKLVRPILNKNKKSTEKQIVLIIGLFQYIV